MKTVKRNNIWFPSLWNEFFADNRLDVPNYETFSVPAVNIQENFANFAIQLAAPGLKKENFAIEVEDNVLKVSAEVTTNTEKSDEKEKSKFTRKEFNYSSFTRSFTLPETVHVDEINAAYEDGVLTITLPKKEEEKISKKMVEIS